MAKMHSTKFPLHTTPMSNLAPCITRLGTAHTWMHDVHNPTRMARYPDAPKQLRTVGGALTTAPSSVEVMTAPQWCCLSQVRQMACHGVKQ